MRYHQEERAMDGNVVAGALAEVFAAEMTSAMATCAGCGTRATLAESDAFVGGPGMVLRCRACRAVLGRVVRARASVWLDLRGVAALQIAAVPGVSEL